MIQCDRHEIWFRPFSYVGMTVISASHPGPALVDNSTIVLTIHNVDFPGQITLLLNLTEFQESSVIFANTNLFCICFVLLLLLFFFFWGGDTCGDGW